MEGSSMVEPLPVKEAVAGSSPALPANTWQHVCTHIVVDCPEYRWELEEHRGPNDEQMLFAHIAVFEFSSSLLRRMRETYRLFRQCVSAPLYALAGEIDADDDKWARFVSNFGFKFLQDVVCENGERRRLFVSLPNKEQQEHERSVLPEPKQNGLPVQHVEPVGAASPVPDAGV